MLVFFFCKFEEDRIAHTQIAWGSTTVIGSIFRTGSQVLAGRAIDQPDMQELWLEFVARHVYTYQPNRKSSAKKSSAFTIQARSRSLDGFTMARFITAAGACELRRDAPGIAKDGVDRYALYLPLRGELNLAQMGRMQHVASGSFAFMTSCEPSVHTKFGDNDTICFLMPRDFVDQRVVCGEQICLKSGNVRKGIGSLAIETIRSFQEHAWGMSDEEFGVSVRLAAEFALLAVTGLSDHLSAERSVRASNLARLKRIIRQRLSDPALRPVVIAQEAGLSLRYAHDLFGDEGQTMGDYLRTQRLQRARQQLETASDGRLSITTLSLNCGFSNSSHFSTAFRKAFGLSPRQALQTR
jgi:AraC-like DNA-binding protein